MPYYWLVNPLHESFSTIPKIQRAIPVDKSSDGIMSYGFVWVTYF